MTVSPHLAKPSELDACTHHSGTYHVQVLEQRIAKLAAALNVLLEAIDDRTAKQIARSIWGELQPDTEPRGFDAERAQFGAALIDREARVTGLARRSPPATRFPPRRRAGAVGSSGGP